MAAAHHPRATSKHAVSCCFVLLSQEQLAQWLLRPLGELDLAIVMVDGIHFRERMILLDMGIDTEGSKHLLGLLEGSATRVVTSPLSDWVHRGLDAQRIKLWAMDGGKTLRKVIVQTFGPTALTPRCHSISTTTRWSPFQGICILTWGLNANLLRRWVDEARSPSPFAPRCSEVQPPSRWPGL